MPPLALDALLSRRLPWLTVRGRATIRSLICDNGRAGSAQAFCDRLGLRNRHQLNRLLKREGLPHYEELAGWIAVLHWMLLADQGECHALRRFAAHSHLDAASSYRLVRRITGRCWTQLRRAGTGKVLKWFLRRTRRPESPQRAQATRPIGRAPRPVTVSVEEPSPQSPAVAWRIALGGAPYGIAFSGREFAYVTRIRGAAVECLDLARGRCTNSIPLGCTPTCVVFNPSATQAYVSVQYCDEIAIVDAVRHVQIGALNVSGNPFPLLLSREGHVLFVTTNEDRLFALNAQSGRIIGTLPLPSTSHHLAMHPSGRRLYVSTRAGGTVLEIDAIRFDVLRVFRLGGWTQGLAVSPDGMSLYVANEQNGVDTVRLATGRHASRLSIAGGAVSLALAPDHRFLYTGLVHAGKVAIIDTYAWAVQHVINTGGRPREIAFDDRGRVLIANECGWVDIFPCEGRRFGHDRPARSTS
jgi:DNA-binding beta-propeller fold protein YncE